MLIGIRNKQQNFTVGVLVAFIGAWLLLISQNCLASIENNVADTGQISDQHCMHDSEGEGENVADLANSHCLGKCDCDDTVVTVSNNKLFGADKAYNGTLQAPFAFLQLPLSKLHLNQKHLSDRQPFKFERAYLRPLDLFCVQLK